MQEEDPTAVDPDEETLAPKPPVENMPPEEGHPAPDDEEEDEAEEVEPMPSEDAAKDPTVDDEEHDTPED